MAQLTAAQLPGPAVRGSRRSFRLDGFDLFTTLLTLGVLFVIVYPLYEMLRFIVVDISLSDWADLFGAPWFVDMVVDTATVAGIACVVAITGAVLIAWINERTDAGLGSFGDVAPLIPLFLPSVAVAIGWVLLATPDVGFLNRLLTDTLGRVGIDVQVGIYSTAGVGLVIALVCLPYAYLPISAAFKSIDPSLEEAARMAGAGPLRVLLTVAVPAIRPAIQAAGVLVLIVSLGQFAIPEVIGTPANVDVMSVRIVRSIRNTYPADYEVAVMLSTLLFAVLVMLWMLQRDVLRTGHFSRVSGRESVGSVIRTGRLRWPLRGFIVGYIVVAVVLPFCALIVVSFQSFWQPDIAKSIWTSKHYADIWGDIVARRAIRNSLIMGLLVGVVVIALSAVITYYGSRRRNVAASLSDVMVKLPAAVPNLIVGIALILAFGGAPFNLGGTLTILGLGFLIVSIPYAAIASESSFASVHPHLREASYMCGASEGRTLGLVVGPLVLPGLFAAWALVFVHILGDLVIAVLLGTGRTPVIGFLLLDTWQQGSWGGVAALALVMMLVSTPVVILMLWLGIPRYRRRSRVRRVSVQRGGR